MENTEAITATNDFQTIRKTKMSYNVTNRNWMELEL